MGMVQKLGQIFVYLCSQLRRTQPSSGRRRPSGLRARPCRRQKMAACLYSKTSMPWLRPRTGRTFSTNSTVLRATMDFASWPRAIARKPDPAIVDRPSRFDRKYHFALPALAERHRFLQRWFSERAELQRPSESALKLFRTQRWLFLCVPQRARHCRGHALGFRRRRQLRRADQCLQRKPRAAEKTNERTRCHPCRRSELKPQTVPCCASHGQWALRRSPSV